MSAEEEAITHLTEIFTIIRDTLEEAKENREKARQLSNEEKQALTTITNRLKQVRTKLNKYLKSMRVQTTLSDFGQDNTQQ